MNDTPITVDGVEYVTVARAAELLECSQGNVRCCVRRGTIESSRIGNMVLVSLAAIEQWEDPRRRALPLDVAAARTTALNRLTAKAQTRAKRDLSKLHPDDYRRLYLEHRAALFADPTTVALLDSFSAAVPSPHG